MEIQSMEASASVLFTTAADRLNHVAMQMQQNEIPPMLQVDQIAALASAAAATVASAPPCGGGGRENTRRRDDAR